MLRHVVAERQICEQSCAFVSCGANAFPILPAECSSVAGACLHVHWNHVTWWRDIECMHSTHQRGVKPTTGLVKHNKRTCFYQASVLATDWVDCRVETRRTSSQNSNFFHRTRENLGKTVRRPYKHADFRTGDGARSRGCVACTRCVHSSNNSIVCFLNK